MKSENIVMSNDKNKVQELLNVAVQLLNSNSALAALDKIAEAKAFRLPVENLDYVRAACFVNLNQQYDAVESLKEELRFFPNNKSAKDLLDEIRLQLPENISDSYGDPEFTEILKIIRPYTMLSIQRLYTLFTNAKKICTTNLPGNFVECGVAAGGTSAMLAYVIKKYSTVPRFMYSCDSFCGLPPASEHDTHQGKNAHDTGWGEGTCAAPEESLKEICTKLGVTDVVRTVKGFFEDTLPVERDFIGMISLLHLDGDWYSSTKTILNNLYSHVVDDGFIQVDDYGYWEGCKKAIHEFEKEHSLQFTLNDIDGTGVWFVKPDKFEINKNISQGLISDFYRDDIVNFGVVSQMSVNERFQLFSLVGSCASSVAPNRFRFIEVGSYAGASLLLTYIAARRGNADVKGYAVEPEGQPQFYEVMRELGQDVRHLKMYSDHAADLISAEYQRENCLADFILIDGDHTYEGVKKDIEKFYPLLRPGGVMLFHDFLPELDNQNYRSIMYHHANNEPGIRRACIELMDNTYKAQVLDLPLLRPTDPTQTQGHLPIIPNVYSTIRVYKKPSK